MYDDVLIVVSIVAAVGVFVIFVVFGSQQNVGREPMQS